MSGNPVEDLVEETITATREMNLYLQEINSALDEAVDYRETPEHAEELLENAFGTYQELADIVDKALNYGNAVYRDAAEREWKGEPVARCGGTGEAMLGFLEHERGPAAMETVASDPGSESKQVMEYETIHGAMRGFEDTLLRFIGVDQGVETLFYESLQDLLDEEDVELPDYMAREDFHESAEIME